MENITFYPGCDDSQGEISHEMINDSNKYILNVSAIAKPGFVFDGWYILLNEGMVFDTKKSSQQYFGPTEEMPTLYAKFKESNYSFCSWETGEENKTLEWRSKRFQNSIPTNLSSVQINGDGYPLEFSVDYASSPDEPISNTQNNVIISITKQDPRRIPMRRPEKYIEIEVHSKNAINDITISTSMGGIINGDMQQQQQQQ